MIEVNNLVYEYPTQRALHGVSFTIAEGSITALVGPNGAGKTTLMKCLAALDKPFSGSIEIDGNSVEDRPREIHRLLGFLPDFFGLYNDLTVEQSLEYFARAHLVATDQIEDRITETIERIGLQDKLSEKVSALSRGMRQRLAIGQTIIHKPKYLVLDEPASGLDPEARFALGEEFTKLNREGLTLIVSSHILAELDQYATDLLILREGRVLEHTSIAAMQHAQNVLELVLSRPFDALSSVLTDVAGTDRFGVEGLQVSIEFSGDDAVREELLRNLIARGVPISQFFVKRQTLQDQYLDQVKEAQS